jgi:hypothetical protein
MASLEDAESAATAATIGTRRRRSFAPHKPGWLTLPSLVY